jgi:hypothetical protein
MMLATNDISWRAAVRSLLRNMIPNGPRNFFEQHVRPNYEEWRQEPLNERRAKNAVSDANNMAARVFHYWNGRDQSQIYGARREGDYRDELAARECPDFALVRDVAEAYKHVELSRPTRRVTRYDQTAAEPTKWNAVRWNEAPWMASLWSH